MLFRLYFISVAYFKPQKAQTAQGSKGTYSSIPSQLSFTKAELDSLKDAGSPDLAFKKEEGGKREKRVIPSKELLSHVPEQTMVTKYGYIESRVFSILENVIETSGIISPSTMESISILDMTMTPDGRDINIPYCILHNFNRDRYVSGFEQDDRYRFSIRRLLLFFVFI